MGKGQDRVLEVLSRAGQFGGALIVFSAGFFAMRSDDWRVIGAFTGLALVGGMVAAAFSRKR